MVSSRNAFAELPKPGARITGPFGPPLKRVSRSSTPSSVRKKCASPGPQVSARCSRGAASGTKALGRAKTPPKDSLRAPANIRPNVAIALSWSSGLPPTPRIVVICLAKSAAWMVTMPLAATGPVVPSPSWTVT